MADQSSSPGLELSLKAEPWLNTMGHDMRFAVIVGEDVAKGVWLVRMNSEASETLEAIEDMVRTWSVD